jgi:hypothetical protein
MGNHKFISKGYGEVSQDWYVWYKHIPDEGHFDPDKQIDYTVWVRYPDVKNGDPANHKDAYFTGFFYTPPASGTQTLTFYVIGDTQNHPVDDGNSTNGAEYSRVMKTMAEDMDRNWYERYRLIIHCGDLNFNGPRTYDYPIKSSWSKEFFGRPNNNEGGDRAKALWILARVPVMVTVGNHDWMWDQNPKRNCIREFVATYPYEMYLDNNAPSDITLDNACDDGWSDWNNPAILYYSFDYGPAHFICLSTFPSNNTDQSTHFDPGSHQVSWLEADLAKTDKEWIFVFTHIPIVDGKGGPHDKPVFDACEPLFQLYGVDAVFQGHEHFYARRYYNGIPYFVMGGGGGELFDWEQPDATILCNNLHSWSRLTIVNNDSCHVVAKSVDDNENLNVIDTLYFYNKPRKK